MTPALPAKILVGISPESNESKEILYWATKVLARPGDIIVALHVIAATPNKKYATEKYRKHVRQAKSFVISIVGEFVETYQSKEVNLEARIGFNSNAGIGLIEEAKNMDANYLAIGGKRSILSNRVTHTISKYCCENVPDNCSFILVNITGGMQQEFHSDSILTQELYNRSSPMWSENNSFTENSFSSEENKTSLANKCQKPSPRKVLDICEIETLSNSTDEEFSTLAESCSENASLSVVSFERKTELRKPVSQLRRISSFFRASFDWSFRKKNAAIFDNEKKQPLLRCFSYEEIDNATNNFHTENFVGQGGYSEVYRGDLKDGCCIAVKRLAKDNSNPKKEKEFLVELGILGHVNHPNTAKLVGCCIENGLYLIFEFYPNGTLSSALHGAILQSLDWPTRFRIILGIARGLHYLHNSCKHRIIHRDIKASNVLLGKDYEPQISDFGLAKWLPSKCTHLVVIPIEGTFGYLAPEYFMHGIVDEKTDVFAFGVLVLEIITGRKPVDSTKQNLLLWAKPLMESGHLSELVDCKLEGRYVMDQMYRAVLTASYCVRQASIGRPSMNEVLQLLTCGQDSETSRNLRIPKFTSDEVDDYSMIFGYELPADLALEDMLK